ncbi:hypothetical protein MF406_03750 [Georgenia sp. TF02-10]|uniref:hypothetical protein n=1 Tax=Georgenia sp. TF02-10 TaxID=2917725 RepID=UPI001FA73D26|nr:hypothetical protein [Georgenia sp. TF02-10]UNX55394.1 hypothetical protein MF406_03750 [Georgenia sp. TF02-10]
MAEPHVFERRPDPPPAKVNAVTMTVTGTVVWMIAAAVVAVLDLLGVVPGRWTDVCLTGVGIGLGAVVWGYVHEYRAQRSTATAAGSPAASPGLEEAHDGEPASSVDGAGAAAKTHGVDGTSAAPTARDADGIHAPGEIPAADVAEQSGTDATSSSDATSRQQG